MSWWAGWVGWRGPGGALEWPQGGLGVVWTDFTIRELSGNYLGTIRDLAGWVGVARLAGPDGREFWNSVKKLILKERNLSFSQQFDHQVTRKNNTKLNLQQTYHKCDVFVLYIFPILFDTITDLGNFTFHPQIDNLPIKINEKWHLIWNECQTPWSLLHIKPIDFNEFDRFWGSFHSASQNVDKKQQ